MNLFVSEIVTQPASLPVTVAAADQALAAAVVEEVERGVLWRGIVRQTRRIIVDGVLPARIEIEPIVSITSFTRWTPTDAAVVIARGRATTSVSRDPTGTIIAPAARCQLARTSARHSEVLRLPTCRWMGSHS